MLKCSELFGPKVTTHTLELTGFNAETFSFPPSFPVSLPAPLRPLPPSLRVPLTRAVILYYRSIESLDCCL